MLNILITSVSLFRTTSNPSSLAFYALSVAFHFFELATVLYASDFTTPPILGDFTTPLL